MLSFLTGIVGRKCCSGSFCPFDNSSLLMMVFFYSLYTSIEIYTNQHNVVTKSILNAFLAIFSLLPFLAEIRMHTFTTAISAI